METIQINYVRYCAHCGSIGPVEDKFRDCCPDGDKAMLVRPEIAEQAKMGFRQQLNTAFADAALLDPDFLEIGEAQPAAPANYLEIPESSFDSQSAAQPAAPTLTDDDVRASHEYSITRDKGCFHAGAIWARNKLAQPAPAQQDAAQAIHRTGIADLTRRNGALLETLQEIIECVDVPDKDCSCHLAPPCGDCVEYGHIRRLLSDAKSLIATSGVISGLKTAQPAPQSDYARLRAAFHVTMLRLMPDKTHEEIDAEIRRVEGAKVAQPAPAPDDDAAHIVACLRNMKLGPCDRAADYIERIGAQPAPAGQPQPMRNDLMQLVEDVFARSEEIGEDSWYNAEELHAISNGAISMPDARFIAAFTPVGVRGLLNGAVQAAPQAAGNAGELTLENAPIGTKAPAISGGNWVRTERGWTWCTGSTFPRPGGDWNGQLIAPVERPTATQAAPAGELAAHLKTADDCFAAAEAEGLTHVLQDSTDERLKDLVIRRLMWARDSIQAAQATLGTQAAPVLGGWKLTPHEPTPEMIAAGREQWHRIGTTTDAWQAMWHAAPATPGEQP